MEYSKSDMRKFHNYELPEDKLEVFEQQIKNELMNESFENFKMSEQLSAELFTPGYLQLVGQKKEEFLEGLPQIKNESNVITIQRIIGIAACICLIGASIFLFIGNHGDISITELSSQSAMSSLNLDYMGTVERGSGSEVQNNVFELYQAKKYTEVISEINVGQKTELLQLLEARSLMHLGEKGQSIKILNVLNKPSFPQRDALLWSLVEIELQFKNIENVKTHLIEIIENNYPNYKNAEEILKNL